MKTEGVTLEVQLPQDVALAMQMVGLERESLPDEMRKALAISLFKRGLFSIGKGAELAGLPLAKFMDLLVENGIPIAEYTLEDFEEDLATLEK